MKKIKNILFCLLSLALVLSLTGCGNNEAKETDYTVGTYNTTVPGHNGDIKVEVTLDEDGLKEVKVLEHAETMGIGHGSSLAPIDLYPGLMVEKQSINVDNVSGATITSTALKSAVKDCLAQAGVAETEFTDEVHQSVKETDYDTDVVVVGGGAAGLSAANAAIDDGKKVILVDKMGIVGGSTAQSGGNIFGANTTLQKENGVEDSAEDLYEFLMSYDQDNLLDAEKIKDYSEGIGADLDYLVENGVKFAGLSTAHETCLLPPRLHISGPEVKIGNGIGGHITAPLTEAFISKGGEILVETKGEELIVEDGVVKGIIAKNIVGDEVTINAKAVILCTGGFGANKDMVQDYMYFNPLFNTAPCNTGDGLVMAEAVDAKVFKSKGMQLQYVCFDTGATGSTESGLVVDINGKRLTNEHGYQSVTAEAFKDAGSYANYYITATKDGVCAEPYNTIQYGVTLDKVAHAATLKELAEQIEVDPEQLEDTVNRYNELCHKGNDDDFGKPAEYMIPVEGDTYYAFAQYPVAAATFGGLVTDVEGHVLNNNDEIVKGLYAAGEIALTGDFAEMYPSCGLAIGNSVHMGIKTGHLAGNE